MRSWLRYFLLGRRFRTDRSALIRIAILGTRGIPGKYGGFETFAEELAVRLVDRGHDVTVYCRTGNTPDRASRHRGVRLVHLPAARHKYAETLSHTLLSAIHAAATQYDVVYICNSANAPICYIPWMRGQRPVLNVDGLEWRRAKWGLLARRYYWWAARLAARMPIEIVTDARVIQEFYRSRLHRESRYFPYGTTRFARGIFADQLTQLNLEHDRYILYASRLERENNALLVVRAYAQVETELPLVVVGDAPYAREYVAEVKAAADPRVRFVGYQFGERYHALQANARIYVQATEVGGTHPALLEAMGHGNAILAHDVPEHREVLGEAGHYFGYRDAASLAQKLEFLLDYPQEVEKARTAAAAADCRFDWDEITRAYEDYFQGLLAR